MVQEERSYFSDKNGRHEMTGGPQNSESVQNVLPLALFTSSEETCVLSCLGLSMRVFCLNHR